MTGLFTRWKKNESSIASHIHTRPLVDKKHTLFEDIIGFEDAKSLFEMAIQAERPVHLLLCGPPASAKSLFMRSLSRLEMS